MSLADALLAELDHEMATTRKLLLAVQESKTSYRPHPKSWTLGELCVHLANILTWVPGTMSATELDLAPPGGPTWTPPKFESAAATVRTFDANVKAARAAIAAAKDADFAVRWSLKNGGATIFTLPRAACLRSFILSHMIHHRGQMTVYLRLCDVPLPSVYGPTADMGF